MVSFHGSSCVLKKYSSIFVDSIYYLYNSNNFYLLFLKFVWFSISKVVNLCVSLHMYIRYCFMCWEVTYVYVHMYTAVVSLVLGSKSRASGMLPLSGTPVLATILSQDHIPDLLFLLSIYDFFCSTIFNYVLSDVIVTLVFPSFMLYHFPFLQKCTWPKSSSVIFLSQCALV
jgi:hypothetical protein